MNSAHRTQPRPVGDVVEGMSHATVDPAATGLPDDLVALLRRPIPVFLSTLAEDGTARAVLVRVETDGQKILVTTREGEEAARNVARDDRIALAVGDPDDPARVYRVRGRVLDITAAGARERRRDLARRYLGRRARSDAPSYDLVLVIEPQRVARAT